MELDSNHWTRSTEHRGNKSYSVEVRQETAEKVISGIWTVADAARNVGCGRTSVEHWVEIIQTEGHLYDHSHRPSYISEKHKSEINKKIIEGTKKGVLVNKRKFGTLLKKAAANTSTEEHKSKKKLTKRFIHDFAKENDIIETNAEILDNAHAIALGDPRHAASFAAMMKYLHSRVPTGLFVNIDKTSFNSSSDTHDTATAMYSGKRPQSVKCEDPYPSGTKGNCSIHLYVVGNDTGKIADVVYLVKDKTMAHDEIDIHQAPMLDCTTNSTGTAYIVFIGESSSSKDAGLTWVLENIVVPFVRDLRRRIGKDDSVPASITIDGDPRQLQVVAGEDIYNTFQQSNIILSKSPASCTPVFQPLDAGKLFLAAKTRFRKLMGEGGAAPRSKEDQEALLNIFRAHRRLHPQKLKKNKQPSLEMNRYFSDVMKCLHTAAAALSEVAVGSVVMSSFQTSGVSPFNIALIRDRCKYIWKGSEDERFITAVPELADIFAQHFELKESDFDTVGLADNNNNRDDLPVHRRRALLLHVPHVLAALREKTAQRLK